MTIAGRRRDARRDLAALAWSRARLAALVLSAALAVPLDRLPERARRDQRGRAARRKARSG